MRIFLTGGTGFIGGHVRRALLERGHQLRVLVHRRGTLEDGCEAVSGEIGNPAGWADALAGCEATVNLIGIIREFPAKGVTFQRLHVQATADLLTAARQAGVRRHLQMSALGARSSAVARYHQSKWQAEELVRASGLDWTIFRPSLVFGRGGDFVTQLAGMLRLPVVPVIGDGRYRLQPVAATDVARCFATALEQPACSGQTYQLCGPRQYSYNELLDTAGQALGRRHIPKLHHPLALMRALIPLGERFAAFPITSDQLTMLLEENICDCGWPKEFPWQPEECVAGFVRYLAG